MPGNILTSQTGLYDPAQDFTFTLVPVATSGSVLSGTVATFTTTAAHGFGAVLTAFQRVPGYNFATGAGPQLGVIISAGAGPTILNSTWLVQSVPTATTFTTVLTPAQAAQAVGSLAGAIVTPFVTIPPGLWDVLLGATDIIQWSTTLPPGPVGGADTTVNGVQGGSVVGFGLLGSATGIPIGNGTYVPFNTGVAIANGDTIQSDGVTFQLVFGATAGVTRLFKRL